MAAVNFADNSKNNLLMKRGYVIIDNGHGVETQGKCSPDGRLQEWAWTRRAARMLAAELQRRGIDCVLLVPEDADVPLHRRVVRVQQMCDSHADAVLVSLHTNASGNGHEWGSASGWSVFVARNASQQSRRLASLLTDEAVARGLGGNRRTPPCGYWQAGFAICRCTPCPAVLTENLFHDNAGDVDYLLSDRGCAEIAALHADAIAKYYGI